MIQALLKRYAHINPIVFILMITLPVALTACAPSQAVKPMQGVQLSQPAPEASGFVTTQSGLQYKDVKEGTGALAQKGNTVSVHYTGTFTNGQKFDSSLDRGEPFSFRLGAGEVIKGWDEGVAGMRIGGKRLLQVPYQLGYGPSDYGPIPGKSQLNFVVELLGVE